MSAPTCTSTDTDKSNLCVRTNVENNKQSNERTKKYLLSSNAAAAAAASLATREKNKRKTCVFLCAKRSALHNLLSLNMKNK